MEAVLAPVDHKYEMVPCPEEAEASKVEVLTVQLSSLSEAEILAVGAAISWEMTREEVAVHPLSESVIVTL